MSRSMLRAHRHATVCPETHKRGYRTRKKALKFAERSMAINGQKLTVYRCPFCPRWHLTKQAQRSGR